MANERELKELLRDTEVSEAEVERYREALALRLASQRQRHRPPLLLWAVPLAAAVLAAILLWPRPTLHEVALADLETRLSRDPVRTEALARDLLGSNGIGGLNAAWVLSRIAPFEEAVEHAAFGLQNDPRPELRRFYLELLLDTTDGYVYNRDLVDALIDRETDPHCLLLFRHLLSRS